jgi:hypothetical protein
MVVMLVACGGGGGSADTSGSDGGSSSDGGATANGSCPTNRENASGYYDLANNSAGGAHFSGWTLCLSQNATTVTGTAHMPSECLGATEATVSGTIGGFSGYSMGVSTASSIDLTYTFTDGAVVRTKSSSTNQVTLVDSGSTQERQFYSRITFGAGTLCNGKNDSLSIKGAL